MNTTPTFTEEERMALLEDAAERWSEALFRFAALRCASRSDAEDVVQEAFLRFATATTPVRNAKAYLFRMVANGCNDLLRRRRPTEPLPPTLEDDPSEEHTLEAEARRLGTLLDRLPTEQAEVIRLHTFASMRFTEIAETLQLPASTVKSRFHYGIERLKKLM